MEPINPSSAWHRARGIALVLAAMLFLYAMLQLVLGSQAGTWRFAAVGSLYACCCLMQQRLLAPARRSRAARGDGADSR